MDREDIIKKISELMPELRERFAVKSLRLFGSFARGDQREDSDVDLIVEFDRSIGLIHHIKTMQFLEDTLDRKVDLVSSLALSPYIRESVLQEAIPI